MILGRAWSAATAQAVVEPAKLSTLGHVQVFAEDAAADEGGEVSFIAPQNNYRLIPQPQKVIDAVLRDGAAARRPGSRGSWSGRSSPRATSRWRACSSASTRAARAAVYPALELREGRFFEPGREGDPAQPRRRPQARRGGGRDRRRPRHHGRRPALRREAAPSPASGWCAGSRPTSGARASPSLAAVQELLDVGRRGGSARLPPEGRRPADSAPGRRGGDGGAARGRASRARAYTWEEMGGPFIGGMIVTRFVGGILHARPRDHRRRGVLNTALMSVFERTREIGTIRAVGSRRSRVRRALPARGPLPRARRRRRRRPPRRRPRPRTSPRHGIPAFSEAQRYSYGGDYLYTTLAWGDLVSVPGAAWSLVSVLAALGPALMAAPLRPGRRAAARVAMTLRLLSIAFRNLLPREAAQRARRRLDGPRHRCARDRLRPRGRHHAPALGQPRGDPDRAPAGGRAAGRLPAAEQPVRRVRPGPAAGRRGPRPPDRGARAAPPASCARCPTSSSAATRSPAAGRASPGSSASTPRASRSCARRSRRCRGRFLPQGDELAVYVAEVGRAQAAGRRRRRSSRSWCRRRRARSTASTRPSAARSGRARPGTTTPSTSRSPPRSGSSTGRAARRT